VELVVRRAIADTGRLLPLAIILGGPYTGREAARLVGDTRGVVVAAISYPFTGDPRPEAATLLREIPRIRAAFLDTPPAIMLALDYLLRLPDVDASLVEVIGVSLGAPFVDAANDSVRAAPRGGRSDRERHHCRPAAGSRSLGGAHRAAPIHHDQRSR